MFFGVIGPHLFRLADNVFEQDFERFFQEDLGW
jgi:hypothetical protein